MPKREHPLESVMRDSNSVLLRKVRDIFVADHPTETRVNRLYYGEWLSYLADRLEAEAARNARLSAKLKDLNRRIKAGELDRPNAEGESRAASARTLHPLVGASDSSSGD